VKILVPPLSTKYGPDSVFEIIPENPGGIIKLRDAHLPSGQDKGNLGKLVGKATGLKNLLNQDRKTTLRQLHPFENIPPDSPKPLGVISQGKPETAPENRPPSQGIKLAPTGHVLHPSPLKITGADDKVITFEHFFIKTPNISRMHGEISVHEDGKFISPLHGLAMAVLKADPNPEFTS